MMERLPSLGPRGEGWFAIQVALMALVAMAGALLPAPGGAPGPAADVAGVLLIAVGGLLGLRALLDLGGSFTPLPRPVPGATLVDRGAYRIVRHPMYAAVLVGALGWALIRASPAAIGTTLVLFAFLDLKSRREEAWLARSYAGFEDYRRRTRRIVPFLY